MRKWSAGIQRGLTWKRSAEAPEFDTQAEADVWLRDLAGCEFQAPQKCLRLIMVYAISFIL
jgi:hypothetical protein